MTKRQKLIRNLIILILLILFIGNISSASLTPLSAHKKSERSANYGPSTIIKSQSIKGGILYLCKYDKWYSLNAVKRGFLWLWYPANPLMKENNINDSIDFTWSYSNITGNLDVGRFFGIVNDPNIKSVRLDIKLNGKMKTFEQNELYDNMFLFIWEEELISSGAIKLTGFDKNSKIIYEKTYP